MSCAPDRHGERVSLVDEDPDLFAGVPKQELPLARQATVVVRRTLTAGPWEGPATLRDVAPFGVLVLEGVVLRRVLIDGRSGAELLSSGDLLRPWLRLGVSTIAPEIEWSVVETARVALLDDRFMRVTSRWPQISLALVDRLVVRSGRLLFQLAVSRRVGVAERLLATFWSFADRWGRVTRDGVVVPLRLSHAVLAEVVGARRPSVTTALGELRRAGALERRRDGTWLLQGSPPESLAQVWDDWESHARDALAG